MDDAKKKRLPNFAFSILIVNFCLPLSPFSLSSRRTWRSFIGELQILDDEWVLVLSTIIILSSGWHGFLLRWSWMRKISSSRSWMQRILLNSNSVVCENREPNLTGFNENKLKLNVWILGQPSANCRVWNSPAVWRGPRLWDLWVFKGICNNNRLRLTLKVISFESTVNSFVHHLTEFIHGKLLSWSRIVLSLVKLSRLSKRLRLKNPSHNDSLRNQFGVYSNFLSERTIFQLEVFSYES